VQLRPRKSVLVGLFVCAACGTGVGFAAPSLAATPAPTVSVTPEATAAPSPAVTEPTAPTLDPSASALPVAAPSIEVPAGDARVSGGSGGGSSAEILGLLGAGSVLIGGATVVTMRRRG
jgi:hypothetical protein